MIDLLGYVLLGLVCPIVLPFVDIEKESEENT